MWTKQIGSGPVKVLLLHGGPGFPHDYLEAMESFLPQAGIEMYYYDQLGVGNSDIPDDPALWTLPRYLTEVEEVLGGWVWTILCCTATRGAASWHGVRIELSTASARPGDLQHDCGH